MAEYSESEARTARRIVTQLLREERQALDVAEDIVVFDLERDAAEFASDIAVLEEFDAPMPALRVSGGSPVPIALVSFPGLQPLWYPSGGLSARRGWWRVAPWLQEPVYDALRTLRSGEGGFEGLELVSREEARSTFTERATDFLATRIAGVRALGRTVGKPAPPLLTVPLRSGGSKVATPGCVFVVSANSPGLRVFWSGAYRISPNYFSHPTTPTTSVLQSGTYIFGVDGGAYGSVIQWDTSAVISLPGVPQTHLNY